MKIRNIIREYFTFTRSERIGLYVLISLIVILAIANQVIFYFETPGEVDAEAFEKLIQAYESQIEESAPKLLLFPFNPNLIDSIALDSLDLPRYVKRNLLSYRTKGGSFKKKQDFRKLYGVNDSIFHAIENFIQIERIEKGEPAYNSSYEEKSLKVETPSLVEMPIQNEPVLIKQNIIELNGADENALKSLNGIGEVLSSRIIKYRNLLGGFYSVSQLKEVYGLPAETYEKIYPLLEVDTNLVRRMNINFASEKELARHPYINWETIRAINNLKSRLGYIQDITVLKEEATFSDSRYMRISPYLKTKDE